MKEIWRCFYKSLKIVISTDKVGLISILILSVILGILPSLSVITMQNIMNLLQIEETPIILIIQMTALYVSIDICNHIMGKLITVLTFSMEKKVNIQTSLLVLEKTKTLELRDYENVETYNLIQRAQNSNQVFSYLLFYISVFKASITIFSNLLILKRWILFVIPFILAITIIRMFYLSKIGKEKFEILRNRTSKERKQWYFKYLLTNDVAFKEIKIFDLYDYFISKYKNLSLEFYHTDIRINKRQHIVDGILLILDSFLTGLVFLTLVINYRVNKGLIGDIVAYVRSISNIKKNLESLCLQIVVTWENTLKISQLFELLDTAGNGQYIKEKEDDVGTVRKVEVSNLNYKYELSSNYALKNVNLTIERGKVYYLVGMNGSGKSTLLKILAGYYNDYKGSILINGKELKNLDQKKYREKISILLQDYVKYELCLYENVILSSLSCQNVEKIKKVLHEIGFDKQIELDTQLGYWFENGCQLSGGEWLKIALARTINRNADIYFLDEPNAALDPIASNKVLNYLSQILDKKIGIIVSHKLENILEHKGEIIFLSEGTLVATGTHDQLFNSCKQYREFIDLQNSSDS